MRGREWRIPDELILMVNRKKTEDVSVFRKFWLHQALLMVQMKRCEVQFPEAYEILVPAPGTQEPVSSAKLKVIRF